MKRLLLPVFLLLSLCIHAQTTILSESFNVTGRTTTPPAGWTVSGTGTNDLACSAAVVWEQVASGGFFCGGTPNPAAHSGSGMAGYNAWDIYSGGKTELVTPALNFSGSGTTTLKVWIWDSLALYFGSPNPQYDSLSIWVNTSPTSAGGTQLYLGTPSYNYSGAGWTQFTFNIPITYTGTTNYIIFRGASLYGNDIFFDDVTVIRNPPTPCAGTPLAPTITTAPLTITAPLCSGSSKTITATDPNYPTIGGINYQWQSSSSAGGPWTNVATGTGATTLNYNTGALTTTTYYRMGSTCTNSSLTAYSPVYMVPVGAPQPSAITGNASFCPGDVTTYSVTNVSGSTYTWTLPSGWSGTSTSNSITVTPGSTPGNISVTATSSCGTSAAQTKAVVVGSAPGVPTAINGPSSACVFSTQTYSIAAVSGATSYSWTLPAGWSLNSTASGGLSITVTTSSTSGTVTVNAVNGCGSSSQSIGVTVVSSLPNPGTIAGPANPCSGALYTYSINPVPGASSYQWVLPSGWSGSISGTSIQVYAGTTGGSLSVAAYSACATSPTATLNTTVTASVIPSVTVAPSTTLICQNAPITFTASPINGGSAPTYVWQKNGIKVLSSGPTYMDNTFVTGDVVTATLVSNATCRTTDSTVSTPFTLSVTPLALPGISISTTPVVTACSGTTFNFNTVTAGGGATPTYQWFVNSLAVGSATGPTYSSALLNNNDTISVRLTTSAICPYVPSVLSNKVVVNIINTVSPTVTVSASSSTFIPGAPITFTATQSGGGATPGFQWMLNGVPVPGETSSTYTTSALSAGDHVWVRMQSYAPCAQPDYVRSNEVVLGGTTGIAGLRNWEGTISLYPNPTSGQFNIAASTSADHIGKRIVIEVLNIVGQSVYNAEIVPAMKEWHYQVHLADGLANGHYILRLSSADGMRANVPFIISR